MTQEQENQVKVTLRRSLIGVSKQQKKIVKALGISKVNHFVMHKQSPGILGMLKKIPHLLTVEMINAG
jgi:large subunit ribosomal protein L30